MNGDPTSPLASSDNARDLLPVVDCTTLRTSLVSLDKELSHAWPQLELNFPQEYLKPRVRSLLEGQTYGEGSSDTLLVLFCFAFSNAEIITLLAKLKKWEDSGYFEIKYCITQIAYAISHTHSDITFLKLPPPVAVVHSLLRSTFTIATLPSWIGQNLTRPGNLRRCNPLHSARLVDFFQKIPLNRLGPCTICFRIS